MHYYYITGTSSGIGKAIATLLLERADAFVIGISRTSTIEHKRYTHVYADLSDTTHVTGVMDSFQMNHTKNDMLYLINNAGVIDPIHYAQEYYESDIQRILQVNLISAVQLISAFLKISQEMYCNRVILSVSSGAATKVIDGWSLYGASKAGLDHFSIHVAKELELKGDLNTRIFSVAPGVVDTPMQQKIQEASSDSFSTLERFLELQKSNQLIDPKMVAQKYLRILDEPTQFHDVVFSLKDIN